MSSAVMPQGRASPAEGTANAKALRLECVWKVSGTAKGPVSLVQSEGAAGESMTGYSRRILVTHSRAWGGGSFQSEMRSF